MARVRLSDMASAPTDASAPTWAGIDVRRFAAQTQGRAVRRPIRAATIGIVFICTVVFLLGTGFVASALGRDAQGSPSAGDRIIIAILETLTEDD